MKKNYSKSYLIPATIILLAIILVIIAPDEKELGSGIKSVYIHVALTWTGFAYYFLSFILALINLVVGSDIVYKWMKLVFRIGFLFYSIGFIMSIVSSFINWGGVNFVEPRFLVTATVIFISIVVIYLSQYSKSNRLDALLVLIPTFVSIFFRISNNIELHPDDPVMNAPSDIQNTFKYLFLLMLFLSGWLYNFFYDKRWKKI